MTFDKFTVKYSKWENDKNKNVRYRSKHQAGFKFTHLLLQPTPLPVGMEHQLTKSKSATRTMIVQWEKTNWIAVLIHNEKCLKDCKKIF